MASERWTVFLFLTATALGCGGSPSGPGADGDDPGSDPPIQGDTLPTGWSWTEGVPLLSPVVSNYPHDNVILASPHFSTYSDAATLKYRVEFAEMAEQAFGEVKTFFGLPEAETVGIDPADPTTRFQIICNMWVDRVQRSYRFGFLLHALPSRFNVAPADWYYRMVKHETIHVFHGFLMGPQWNTEAAWFKEGLAEYGADGGFFGTIRTPAEFQDAVGILHGYGLDPISMEVGNLYGLPEDAASAAYRLWGLIFRYLMEPAGRGRTMADLVALFDDVKTQRDSFLGGFENHLGISQSDYEAGIMGWLEAYLSAQGTSGPS